MKRDPIRVADVHNWSSDLVFVTLEELTSNLDGFLDRMSEILESGAARPPSAQVVHKVSRRTN